MHNPEHFESQILPGRMSIPLSMQFIPRRLSDRL